MQVSEADINLLAICIPTFQRFERLRRIVDMLEGDSLGLELCIVVDGSTDSTLSFLESKKSARLKYLYQENQGRSVALRKAVELATSPYIMLFDDDDVPNMDGLRIVIDDLRDACRYGADVAGFVYNMSAAESGETLGGVLPNCRTNFLRLRADQGVDLDRKEVIRADILKEVFSAYKIADRRIPTSLYWSTLALDHDVICRNVIVGAKHYLQGGLTSDIRRIKNDNPFSMLLLNKVKLNGFFKGRYTSKRYFFRSLVSFGYYGFLLIFRRIKTLSLRKTHD